MTAKSKLVNWICIHLIRIKEKNGENPIADKDIQERICKATEKDDYGDIIDPLFSIGHRAEDLLPTEIGCKKHTIQNAISWFFGIASVATLFWAVISVLLGYLTKILPSTGEADLIYFIYLFFVPQLILLAFSIGCTLYSLISFYYNKTCSEMSSIGAGWVGATISYLAQWAVSRPIIGGAKILGPLSVLFQEIFSKSRVVLSLATALTHLYWLTVALFVCASMDVIFENVKYDFRLESTTTVHSNADSKIMSGIRMFGPMTNIFGYKIPTQDDIKLVESTHEEYLAKLKKIAGLSVEGEKDEILLKIEENTTLEQFKENRREAVGKCADFLIGLTLVWCLVPRLVMFLFAVLLYKISKKDIMPNVSEPYYQRLISDMQAGNKIEAGGIVVPQPPSPPDAITTSGDSDKSDNTVVSDSSTTVAEEISDDTPKPVAPVPPVNLPNTVAPTTTVNPPTSNPIDTEPPGNPLNPPLSDSVRKSFNTLKQCGTIIQDAAKKIQLSRATLSKSLALACACGTTIDEKNWKSILEPENTFKHFANFPNHVDEITAWIGENRDNLVRFVTLFAVGSNPDYGTLEAFKKLLEQLPHAQKLAILTGGETLRLKYDDTEAIAALMGAWRDRLEGVGLTEDRIVEFDHEHETELSRKRIRDMLAGKDVRPFQLAGKFGEAMSRILASARSKTEIPKEQVERFEKLHQSIRELYAPQFNLFQTIAAQIDIPSDFVGQSTEAMNRLGEAGTAKIEEVKQGYQTAAKMLALLNYKGIAKEVGSAAVVGTALAGLTLVGGPFVLPIMAIGHASIGSFLLGVSGYAAFWKLPALSPFFTLKEDKKKDATPSTDNAIRDLVFSGTTWVLVFEMQGLPEEKLADNLAKLLHQFRDKTLNDERQRSQVLQTISTELKELYR